MRLAARSLIRKRWFDRSVDMCILINCFLLALRDPTAESECAYADDQSLDRALFVFDVAFTSVFMSELLLKLLVHGILQHPGAYLRDGWNVIDGFVAVTSLLGLLPGLSIDQAVAWRQRVCSESDLERPRNLRRLRTGCLEAVKSQQRRHLTSR